MAAMAIREDRLVAVPASVSGGAVTGRDAGNDAVGDADRNRLKCCVLAICYQFASQSAPLDLKFQTKHVTIIRKSLVCVVFGGLV